MGAKGRTIARLVYSDSRGRVLDRPGVEAACRIGDRMARIDPDDLIPLPEGSELYFLPQRRPVGFTDASGSVETLAEGVAVAAFLPPGYSVFALAAYRRQSQAPVLPLYTYAAVCWYRGRFHVPARRVETDVKHDPSQFSARKLQALAAKLRGRLAGNRLARHLGDNCALRYGCANAKNLLYSRWECPIPVSPTCNAVCVGCISAQPNSTIPSPQERLSFVPSIDEVLEIAVPHLESAPGAMVSFGQGCEGEPLLQGALIEQIVRAVRRHTDRGTIHLNTNGSRPSIVARLCDAGLDSIRVSLNSAQPELYTRYYRPRTYGFEHVLTSIRVAHQRGRFTSINYLAFPGVTDSPRELEALSQLIEQTGLNMIQWRNLNIDPDTYVETIGLPPDEPALGMRSLLDRVRARFPYVRQGYVNPPRELWGKLEQAPQRNKLPGPCGHMLNVTRPRSVARRS